MRDFDELPPRRELSDRHLGEETSAPMTNGRVHSVETFGTVDGPGIRYVVFFQGCPLRCLYCQNRDTWDPRGGRETTVSNIVSDLRRYRTYIESSGGGLTATGGEPLFQARFAAALFEMCRAEGVHSALDTSGYSALTPPVVRLLNATDLVILDIKQVDDAIHRSLTSASNRMIVEFARHVAFRRIPLWIRHVVVPHYTTSENSARATARFIRSLDSVERVELVAYHEFGRYKWEALGQPYPLADNRPPTDREMAEVAGVFAAEGIPVVV